MSGVLSRVDRRFVRRVGVKVPAIVDLLHEDNRLL
jgi:hypothetical protein